MIDTILLALILLVLLGHSIRPVRGWVALQRQHAEKRRLRKVRRTH
jgi:hypothetical protein